MTSESLPPTARLAAFVATLTYDDLDDDVATATRNGVLDTLGACYAGTTTTPGEIIQRYVGRFDGDAATITGRDRTTVAHLAALANGTSAHALDVDDGHRAGSAHLGSAVVPAALALGEARDISGRELLTAVAAGYEAMAAVAVAVQTSHRERGFHATGTAGCFGAAAAASSVLDLDETSTAHALGLAGTQAGGLFEFLEKGSMAKRYHPGRAAMAGVMAAELASEGFDGPDTVIEGKNGFARAFADEHDFGPFDRLGDPFAVTRTYIKPYPACRHVHGPIDAALALREEVAVDEIEGIWVETYRSAAHHDAATVNNLLDAQMSLPYCVAVAFVEGEVSLSTLDPVDAERDSDTDGRAEHDLVTLLAANTTVVATEEMERRYPETRPARIVVTTAEGRTLERIVEYPRGAAESPLSVAEVAEKFRSLSANELDPAERDAIINGVQELPEADSTAEFATLL